MDYTQLAAELMQCLKQLHKTRKPTSITESMRGESFILQFISHCGGEVAPGGISCEMDISSARITAILNNLESKGMITRRIDPSDRRRVLVELTQTGRSEAEKHRNMILKDISATLCCLGEEDAREFVRILGRLSEIATEKQTTECSGGNHG